MVQNRIIFFATSVQPNPEEIDYWVDLSDNPYGGSIKYFNGTEWVRLAASGGTPDINNYYTKTQINNLLNNKADVGDVDSKVDDEEVKDVIKDIQFNTSNPNGITMVMFKYDGSNKTVSIPVASTSSAGIITSKDFLDFVKQHQLQELHTEMIDTFADVRAKYQKKLIAGLNIEIDQETNVISASGDLAVQWNKITDKPDFKPVATSGDYNDLINKLKPGKDVSISEDNTISIAIDSDSLEQSLATLQSNIDKEAATARTAETKLGNDIATEKNRAESAEQTISTNLQNEIDRSTQIDTQHTNAINKEIQDRKEAIATEVSDRNAAILVETNRAKAKEEALRTDVEDLTGQVLILEKTKVNKVEGKGLSTNDYTTPEKNKLAAIEAEANKYVLPAATASALGGVKIGSNITLANGGTISITKANVTSALGVDPTTTYVKKAGDTMTGSLTIETTSDINLYSNVSVPSSRWAVVRLKSGDEFWDVTTKYGSGFRIQKQGQAITELVVDDSGNVTNTGYLKSKVATGTAPIQVSSTTLCTNLNADMVDGYGVSEFNSNSISVKYSINSVNQANAENWIKVCTLPLVDQEITQDKKAVFEIVGGADSGEKYTYYGILTASTRYVENVELRILSSMAIPSVAVFIAGYVVTSNEVEIWIRTSAQWGTNTNIVCKWASTHTKNILSSPATTQRPSNFVLGNIKTLDAPDWYGVSWSETSSNPDCTRIGNMDMHRSLPIQSMMRSCVITNSKSTWGPGSIRYLNNDYKVTGGFYSDSDQNFLGNDSLNVMVEIPEFWYIDEYVDSSKTHNLKICPHAKPGWNHHKKAYVGAYEGVVYDDKYYSNSPNTVGLKPTINVTRESIRTKARANGPTGQSKWNIYTYEEHRAICHLFLVEYATRNSQKAVNTKLTPEGFRQGGLGSGCTTGTATIHGATTWSFIPTGSSNSLGSGSGEVTVTIQQTDSSGANTTTITRKCNRYRGIENPFGHIWKHTDDVISIYKLNYRHWCKCYNPTNFSNNKNDNYIAICASSVVTGYKTQIIATPNCDFFARACTNGSETTYWCDYNWDNTDTSEHCLLIGGDSGNGGQAGLFALNSYNGVGNSRAHIGSRLTYLPWAE